MPCRKCPNATTVYLPGGMYIDCEAIRAMDLPPARHASPPYRVMVYMDQLFIPQACPNPDVPADLKVRIDFRKSQPCRDENGAIIPRISKRKKGVS